MENSIVWLTLFALIYYGVIWNITPKKTDEKGFFSGSDEEGKEVSFLLLTLSAAISWIFAKSIMNSANLTYAFGFSGGVGYGIYYLSFIVAAIVIYFLRVRGGYSSIADFLVQKYGPLCAKIFFVAIAIRLFNEVWSNTKVVGLFFGAEATIYYWSAIAIFTTFTLIYTWKGGLRGSIVTDGVQMLFAAILLTIVLIAVFPEFYDGLLMASNANHQAGLTFCLLAFVQIFSYPFHDPVLTDRGFITKPKVMLKALSLAGIIGGLFIILFGFVGAYGRSIGFEGGNIALSLASTFSLPLLVVFNIIMLTTAGSTLDSTFASTAKLSANDWNLKKNKKLSISKGRLAMIVIAILGNIPLFSIYFGDKLGPAIISATTISGTMVMGLAPIFILSFLRTGYLSFHFAFWPGIIYGIMLVVAKDAFPDWVIVGEGKYALTAGVNLYGVILCSILFFIGYLIHKYILKDQN